MARSVVYERRDDSGTWGWRLRADNGDIIATDGGQGYENEAEARAMVDKIIGGAYKDAEQFRDPIKKDKED
ncbi:protein of unknown function [Arthrobacter sp. 31Cvi3.1E]|nr:protein of unknown function [Arthrobacter sp. 31Cvi3.1E]